MSNGLQFFYVVANIMLNRRVGLNYELNSSIENISI
jgi:hypothetical protein